MTASGLATALGAFLIGQIIAFWLFSMWHATRRQKLSARRPQGDRQARRKETRPPLSVS